ncbi:metal ABC transporter permease [Peribacillus simplex]|uniref:Iron ABC transporter n=2 Tax=Peribacillus simplex TaxID=1478 RepID=A0A223EI65_9BACI|nr:metal ABC transporter permease [Peribacillus simplex]ASS94948.1 iron ABC transporter [Peribacillus simplex NBRC 15720 = DSM 1321]MEC1398962.1 metal ABC transporter permease [Peribacillus simplex]MED3910074.1 metal ABC transporter permease [Peribacillus simplex]MED3984619.1 metal ABC transporter permease [Peribacillus simplex]MED4093120.1 metal ABC transporter permease [Peribacillus simplex]
MNDFWIILVGALVAGSCSVLGCFLIVRKMTLIGDAISHSVLPGIVLAFLITGTRDSVPMLIGAAALGLLTVFLIQLFQSSGVQADAAIGIVFTSLFATGIVLVSLYTQQIDFDLEHVLYGEIAYTPWNTMTIAGIEVGPKAVWIVGSCFILNLILIFLFFKQFKLVSFDPSLAAAMGIPVLFFHYLLMSLISLTTVASFDSVGSILVVGMLIIPAATAYLLSDRLSRMILVSIGVGVLSSVIGYYSATILDASISGCMVGSAAILFGLAFLFSPSHGLVSRLLKRRKSKESQA